MPCDRTTPHKTTGIEAFFWQVADSQIFAFSPRISSMKTRHRSPTVPSEVIILRTYAQVDLYLAKFFVEELGLVLLLDCEG
jgi:hypothetical protein